MATHNSTLNISVTLIAPGGSQAGFGGVCLVVDSQSFGGSPLGGDDVAAYSTSTAVDTAAAAGEISEAVATTLKAGLATGINTVYVADYDGTSEDPGDAIERARASALDDSIYVYVPFETGSTTDADADGTADILTGITALSGADKLYLYQQSDTTTAVAAHVGIENVGWLYHDATPSSSVAHQMFVQACNRARFNPDTQAAGWKSPIPGGVALTSDISQATNATVQGAASFGNTSLPFFGEPTYFYPGQNSEGTSIKQVVSKHWFKARLTERIANLIIRYDNSGRIIPLDATGQDIIDGEIRAQYALGVEAGAFQAGQLLVTFPTISAADLAANRLRVTVSIALTNEVLTFDIGVNLSTSEVV